MFYSIDFLSKGRQNSLAVIWIAATLGSKSNSKKLSRKDVLGVDITKACEFLEHPPEPLALRLSSNLMVGVARVFRSQYDIYLTDVNNVFGKLKKAFTTIQNNGIDMPQVEARNDAITADLIRGNLFMEPDLDLNDLLNISINTHLPSIATPPKSSPGRHMMGHPIASSISLHSGPNSINLVQHYPGSIGMSSLGEMDVAYNEYLNQDHMHTGKLSGIDADWTLDLDAHGDYNQSGLNIGDAVNDQGETGFGFNDIGLLEDTRIAQDSDVIMDIMPQKQKQKRSRLVKLVDHWIELTPTDIDNMKNLDEILEHHETSAKKRKLDASRSELVKSHFGMPAVLKSSILVQFYKNAVKSFEPVKNTSEMEAFRNDRTRQHDNHLTDPMNDNTGWNHDQYNDLEVARDVQEVTDVPWARTSTSHPANSTSNSSVTGGFQPETPRMSLASVANDSSIHPGEKFIDENTANTETSKFFNYVKGIMNLADSHQVFLFDLIQAPSSRSVASQAFYHMLVLATRGDVTVEQDGSFNDICITSIDD